MKSQFFPNRVFLATLPCDWVELRVQAASKRPGQPGTFVLWCNSWHDASASSMLGTCASFWRLATVSHPRVPVSLHNLEQFFTLSHTLPLHDSHLNIGLLIAKIQANLAWNKANKMVDKIQPYSFFYFLIFNDKNHAHFLINVLTKGESPNPRPVKQNATEGGQ